MSLCWILLFLENKNNMEANWRNNYLRYKSFFLNMFSQYQERSDWRAYLEILLSLATISMFSVFALKPTVLTIADLIKEIDEKKQTVQRMDDKIQNLSKAQIVYDQWRGNIATLKETAIPKSANSDIFARQIEGLSTKYQVGLPYFSLDKSSMFGTAPALPPTTDSNTAGFAVTISGEIDQYSSISQFLLDFENLRQPPSIDRVELRTEENRDTLTKIINLLITGQLHYLP